MGIDCVVRSISKGIQKALSAYLYNEVWNCWDEVIKERTAKKLSNDDVMSVVILDKNEFNGYQRITFVKEKKVKIMKTNKIMHGVNLDLVIIKLDSTEVMMTEKEARETFKGVDGFAESL